MICFEYLSASIAQLGERKTEDLEAPCSIHGRSMRNSEKSVKVWMYPRPQGRCWSSTPRDCRCGNSTVEGNSTVSCPLQDLNCSLVEPNMNYTMM